MPRRKAATVSLPLVALRGLMVFPHMVLNFDIGRSKSVRALEMAMMNDQPIFLVAQKDAGEEDPGEEGLCTVGTIALIKQVMNLPGDAVRVLVEGDCRGVIKGLKFENAASAYSRKEHQSRRRRLLFRRWQ